MKRRLQKSHRTMAEDSNTPMELREVMPENSANVMCLLLEETWRKETVTNRTDERPTPTRTPNDRTSHHKNAPTRPAAPVPDAKYLKR